MGGINNGFRRKYVSHYPLLVNGKEVAIPRNLFEDRSYISRVQVKAFKVCYRVCSLKAREAVLASILKKICYSGALQIVQTGQKRNIDPNRRTCLHFSHLLVLKIQELAMKNAIKLGIIVGLLGHSSLLLAATIYVPLDQPTIQAGINVTQPGDTVLVADGIYKGEGNKNLNFDGKPITLQSANGPTSCIIDCEGDGRGFLFNSGEQESSILSGFTITNGNSAAGGAIYCYNTSPTIKNCKIIGNSASDWGGGICLWGPNSSPLIAECVISRNSVNGSIPGDGGGGIFCADASPSIKNSIVSSNSADALRGGGIATTHGSSLNIINCTISNNSALAGGAISCGKASPKITNSILWGNVPDSLSVETGSIPIISYSDVQGGFHGEGNFCGDPLFVDADNDNYHLSVSSPCMDAGTADGAPATDLDGNPRPQRYRYDLGAYEVTGYDKLRPIIDSFTADIAEGFIPFQVVFECGAHDTDGEITSYRIDYGDGSATETNTSGLFAHNYVNKGVASATCIVTDDSGAETNSFSIMVKRNVRIRVPADFITIQNAIDAAAHGDAVTVSDGTYKGIGNKNLDFKGKAITVESENGPTNSIIDCENDGQGFSFHSGEGPDSILRGFTITRGRGGAVLCRQSSPTVANCIVKNNTTLYTSGSYSGGGIVCASSDPNIVNCIISHNVAGASGGGIYCSGACSPKVINCTITGNSCNEDYEISGGGGIFADTPSKPVIMNSIVWGNSPNDIKAGFGGGFSVTYSNVRAWAGGEGNIDLNPAFVESLSDNYRPKDTSPCIGAGTLANAPATDIDGNPRPNPAGSNPDMGAYESPLAARTTPPLDIFGMVGDNEWVYEGTKEGNPYKVERKVTTDASGFPIPIFAYEIKENGAISGREYYQKTPDQVLLWGSSIKNEGSLYDLKFSNGLSVILLPLVVGDHRYSSTTGEFSQFPGYSFNVSMDFLVVTQETVDLGFDTFEAYKVRYEMRVWGPGLDYTEIFFWWVVPYVGVIKDEDSGSMVKLTSFAVGEGTVTDQSDADRDGLKDYQELFKFQTDWLDSDTDDDECLDGMEVQGGRNPMVADPEGDLNGDCALNLADAIFGLRVMVGIDQSDNLHMEGDVNGDGKVGSEEIIWILQKISGLR